MLGLANNFTGRSWTKSCFFAVGLLIIMLTVPPASLADTISDVNNLIEESQKANGEGDISTAETKLNQALTLSVRGAGAMSSVSGKTARLLGTFYMNNNRLSDAEHFLIRSLIITSGYSGALSDSNGEFLNTRTFVSNVLQNPTSLPGSIEVSNTLSSLATLYTRQGRYSDAERILKRVVQINENGGANAGNLLSYSPDSSSVLAESQRSLAQVLYKEGNVVEAESMFKTYVNTVRKHKGNSQELSEALNNLAAFYKSQNRSGDADAAETEAREVRNRTP